MCRVPPCIKLVKDGKVDFGSEQGGENGAAASLPWSQPPSAVIKSA